MDVEDKTISQDGEEWGEAFNGVDQRYWDFLRSCGG